MKRDHFGIDSVLVYGSYVVFQNWFDVENSMKTMTIGRAARRAEVGVETIRFYERKGLIDQPLKPLDTGFRVYPDETVQRIRFIRQAQEIGFSLREITELLSLKADPSADCADVRAQAVMKLDEVDRKIARLEKIRGALGDLIAACPGRGALRACSIMDALVPVTGTPGETKITKQRENA